MCEFFLSGRPARPRPWRVVSLRLVIGPANAEKAGVALDAYRAELSAGADPVLIVPTFPDVEVYRRELAAGGAGVGGGGGRLGWLPRGVARPAGGRARPAARLPRGRVGP